MKKVIAITGPTASGKTGLAVFLAQKLNGEVISVDSRQVYKGLDIGTEKITETEMQGVPHHLIDIVEPEESFSVDDFVNLAENKINEITDRGHIPILAGGTYFWLDALLYGKSYPNIPPDEGLRQELENKSLDTLLKELEEKDPERFATVDRSNKRRVVRALEIVNYIGKVPATKDRSLKYDALIIALKTDRAELREKIANRLEETLSKGLLDEVKNIMQSLSSEKINELGLEYRIGRDYLNGEITEAEMLEKMISALYKYSKLQNNWLKKNENIVWVERKDEKLALELCQKHLAG